MRRLFSKSKIGKMAALTVLTLLLSFSVNAGEHVVPPVHKGSDGNLVYHPDSLGNRIPDFSYCGYKAFSTPIPDIPVKVVVNPVDGDATSTIQKAIDYVASLPLNKNGFRGTILLKKGTYHVNGRFTIKSSGIVLRGEGFNAGDTRIIADGISRETLFRFWGGNPEITDAEIAIMDNYVPVNANSFDVKNSKNLKKGDKIFITRVSTWEWVDFLNMRQFGGQTGWLGWRENERDIIWDRTITSISGNTITVDAPITTAIDKKFGGGHIKSYQWAERVKNCGIENIALESSYNSENVKDEEHCWNAVSFENARDCWVRQVTFRHFAGSAVAAYETASRITVEDALSFEPVSEIGGLRRYTFYNRGQQNLFQRLYAEHGYHDFSTGMCAAGPNAFVQCKSHLPYNFSGTVDSWASGVLFDIVDVDGHSLGFQNRGPFDHGAGWTAANSMLWQCTAANIFCFAPPGAQNWAFGTWGRYFGNGYWYEADSHIKPRSLFYAQLADRIGQDNVPDNPVIVYNTNATSSPTVEQAAEIVEFFQTPVTPVKNWIAKAPLKNPIPITTNGAPDIETITIEEDPEKLKSPEKVKVEVINGWLVSGRKIIIGNRAQVPWWSGSLRPRGVRRAKMAITRYVPGRVGKGYTDILSEVMNEMEQNHLAVLEQNYGLWYDRRRDDHVRVRRMDGNVWAPFYEQPFARSGQGQAWDGLSKYDLTKYNAWYWGRLKHFANLAEKEGKILVHHNYFQHNILEAGAHWVDSPWRTTNNINNTDFPEPPPFAGDKRIFIADRFYDINHPVRRELHRKYIRQCLDNFAENTNVIQTTSEEYTGPLHFVEFWIDVIAEWEAETGNDAQVALSTTKDVQDAVLADPVRSKVVDIIDIRYWSSRADGTVFAPKGGQNLAPRQHMRKMDRGKRSIEQVYSDVLTYKIQFPGKAVMYSENQSPSFAWGVFMAGGSLAPLPEIEAQGFLKSAATMVPVTSAGNKNWVIKNSNDEQIIYCHGNTANVKVDLTGQNGIYEIDFIDPQSGKVLTRSKTIKAGSIESIKIPDEQTTVLWLHKK
jgi:hypothetical protein